MSLSTRSELHPIAAVAAPVAPRTLRNSRRRTPFGPELSVIQVFSIVTGAAVVARPPRRVDVPHVAGDAPAHVERCVLVDAVHLLHLAVAGLACDAGVDVPHVRELHVVGNL